MEGYQKLHETDESSCSMLNLTNIITEKMIVSFSNLPADNCSFEFCYIFPNMYIASEVSQGQIQIDEGADEFESSPGALSDLERMKWCN